MSHTDPANYPECLARVIPRDEAWVRSMERFGDLHERARLARKTRGPARIHYQLFMLSLSKSDLVGLGINSIHIMRYCTQLNANETECFNLSQLLRIHRHWMNAK